MATNQPPSESGRFLAVANVLASQFNTALAVAGAFLVTPAVLSGLGDSGYGGWLLMNSMIGYMRLLDQGTSTGTMKNAAAALARRADAEVKRVFNTSAAMFAVAGLLAAIATCGLAILLPRYYGGIIGDDWLPILVLGAATSIDLFVRVYPAALRTRSLFVVVDGVEIFTYLVFKLGLVLYFSSSLSYQTLSYIVLGEALTRNAIVVGLSRRMCPFVRHLRPLSAERVVFKQLVSISAALSILMLADAVRFQLDAAVIGYFMPSDPVAISTFAIGTRLPSMAYFAIGVIGAVLIPRFSGLSATGEQQGARDLLRVSSLATGLASVYVLVNCAVIGPQFLFLWLKKPWVLDSGSILILMLPAYFIALLGGPASGLLVGRGRLRGLVTITVAEAAANLLLTVVLVRSYGIYGVALGTIIPMIVVRGVIFPMVLHREMDLRPLDYWHLHFRAIGIGVVYLALVSGLTFSAIPTYGRFLALGAASTLVFAIVMVLGVPDVRSWMRTRLLSLTNGQVGA